MVYISGSQSVCLATTEFYNKKKICKPNDVDDGNDYNYLNKNV